jgi:type IV pilus assembly protein PilC
MATYEYRAETRTGDPVSGKVFARDEEAARRELESRRLHVVGLLWCPAVDAAGNLQEAEVTTLVEAVGAAAASRLPLDVTLAAIADEHEDRRLAGVAQQLASQMANGATMEQAVAALEGQVPTEVAGLLRAGVESGDLAATFEQVAQQRSASGRTQRRIRAALAYPLLIVSILVPLLLFLSGYVIPMFGALFTEMDLDLPKMTILVLQTARQLPALIIGLLVLVIGIPIVLRIVGGRWLLHRVRAALPVVGRIWTWSGQREFAALLRSFINLRLPLPSAIARTGEVISDRNLARACQRVCRRLDIGQPLSDCLSQSIHFDRTLVALVAWGEKHGVLPEALRVATDVFDDQIEQQAALVRRLVPPVTFVIVVTMMAFVVVSLMVPMVKLIEGLSK